MQAVQNLRIQESKREGVSQSCGGFSSFGQMYAGFGPLGVYPLDGFGPGMLEVLDQVQVDSGNVVPSTESKSNSFSHRWWRAS